MIILAQASTNAVVAAANNVSATMEHLKQKLVDLAIDHGMQAIAAILILMVGLLVARWVGGFLQGWLDRQPIEPPVRALLVRLAKLVVMAFTLVMVLDKFGVNVATLIAGIGIAGVGIGLAMQGVLGNVVAGLTIIFTKPFRVGEYIELLGVNGQVRSIELATTTLTHADLSRVVIPNRKIIGEVLHNYGEIRQLDLSTGVAYGSDLKQVFAVVEGILAGNPRVLKNPAPVLGVAALSDSAITIAVKPWVAVPDYNQAQAEVYQSIITEFSAKRISIPFPQREVRMIGGE